MYHRASSVVSMYSYNLSQFILKLSSFIPTTRCHDVSFCIFMYRHVSHLKSIIAFIIYPCNT